MPSGQPIGDEETAEILTQYIQYKKRKPESTRKDACAHVGIKVGRRWEVIAALVQRYTSTTDLATAIIRKSAAELARKVVKDADVDQAIEVLSRPNIGVLAPASKGGMSEGPVNFSLSVSAESCGAVMIGVNSGQGQLREFDGSEGDAEGQHLLGDGRETDPEEEWIGGLDVVALHAEIDGLQTNDESPQVQKVGRTREQIVAEGRAKIEAARRLSATVE